MSIENTVKISLRVYTDVKITRSYIIYRSVLTYIVRVCSLRAS